MKLFITLAAVVAVAVAVPVQSGIVAPGMPGPTPVVDDISVGPAVIDFTPVVVPVPSNNPPNVQIVININQAAPGTSPISVSPVAPVAPVIVSPEVQEPIQVVDPVIPEPIQVVDPVVPEPIQILDPIVIDPVSVGTPVIPSPVVVLPDELNPMNPAPVVIAPEELN